MQSEAKQFEPQAYLTVCNFGGIEIEINPAGDSVRWRYNFGEDDPALNNEIHESEIIYNIYGDMDAGFLIGEEFYSLKDFMRI